MARRLPTAATARRLPACLPASESEADDVALLTESSVVGVMDGASSWLVLVRSDPHAPCKRASALVHVQLGRCGS